MDKIHSDDELDKAIKKLDKLLELSDNDEEIERHSEMIYEYEERTDILNRK